MWRDAIRLKHYSIRAGQAYANWIKRYIFFHDKRHPAEMGAQEWVLHQDLGPIDARHAKKPKRLPSVLTKEEMHRVLGHLSGTHLLMAHG